MHKNIPDDDPIKKELRSLRECFPPIAAYLTDEGTSSASSSPPIASPPSLDPTSSDESLCSDQVETPTPTTVSPHLSYELPADLRHHGWKTVDEDMMTEFINPQCLL